MRRLVTPAAAPRVVSWRVAQRWCAAAADGNVELLHGGAGASNNGVAARAVDPVEALIASTDPLTRPAVADPAAPHVRDPATLKQYVFDHEQPLAPAVHPTDATAYRTRAALGAFTSVQELAGSPYAPHPSRVLVDLVASLRACAVGWSAGGDTAMVHVAAEARDAAVRVACRVDPEGGRTRRVVPPGGADADRGGVSASHIAALRAWTRAGVHALTAESHLRAQTAVQVQRDAPSVAHDVLVAAEQREYAALRRATVGNGGVASVDASTSKSSSVAVLDSTAFERLPLADVATHLVQHVTTAAVAPPLTSLQAVDTLLGGFSLASDLIGGAVEAVQGLIAVASALGDWESAVLAVPFLEQLHAAAAAALARWEATEADVQALVVAWTERAVGNDNDGRCDPATAQRIQSELFVVQTWMKSLLPALERLVDNVESLPPATVTAAVSACSAARQFVAAHQLLRHATDTVASIAVRRRLLREPPESEEAHNALVVDVHRNVVQRMIDTPSLTALAHCIETADHLHEFRTMFAESGDVLQHVPVTVPLYTAIIAACGRAVDEPKRNTIALALFRALQDAGEPLTVATYAATTSVAASCGETSQAFALFTEARGRFGTMALMDASLTAALIQSYARGSYHSDAVATINALHDAGAPLSREAYHAAMCGAATLDVAMDVLQRMVRTAGRPTLQDRATRDAEPEPLLPTPTTYGYVLRAATVDLAPRVNNTMRLLTAADVHAKVVALVQDKITAHGTVGGDDATQGHAGALPAGATALDATARDAAAAADVPHADDDATALARIENELNSGLADPVEMTPRGANDRGPLGTSASSALPYRDLHTHGIVTVATRAGVTPLPPQCDLATRAEFRAEAGYVEALERLLLGVSCPVECALMCLAAPLVGLQHSADLVGADRARRAAAHEDRVGRMGLRAAGRINTQAEQRSQARHLRWAHMLAHYVLPLANTVHDYAAAQTLDAVAYTRGRCVPEHLAANGATASDSTSVAGVFSLDDALPPEAVALTPQAPTRIAQAAPVVAVLTIDVLTRGVSEVMGPALRRFASVVLPHCVLAEFRRYIRRHLRMQDVLLLERAEAQTDARRRFKLSRRGTDPLMPVDKREEDPRLHAAHLVRSLRLFLRNYRSVLHIGSIGEDMLASASLRRFGLNARQGGPTAVTPHRDAVDEDETSSRRATSSDMRAVALAATLVHAKTHDWYCERIAQLAEAGLVADAQALRRRVCVYGEVDAAAVVVTGRRSVQGWVRRNPVLNGRTARADAMDAAWCQLQTTVPSDPFSLPDVAATKAARREVAAMRRERRTAPVPGPSAPAPGTVSVLDPDEWPGWVVNGPTAADAAAAVAAAEKREAMMASHEDDGDDDGDAASTERLDPEELLRRIAPNAGSVRVVGAPHQGAPHGAQPMAREPIADDVMLQLLFDEDDADAADGDV